MKRTESPEKKILHEGAFVIQQYAEVKGGLFLHWKWAF
jgi:hypothetical protein